MDEPENESDSCSFWDWAEEFEELDDDAARVLVLLCEEWTDLKLARGDMVQEEAWDHYFGLLHVCDLRNFSEDRKRIVKKIDTARYDPQKSKNPQVVYLALFRAKGMGLI